MMRRRSLLFSPLLCAGAILTAFLPPLAESQVKHRSTADLVRSSEVVAVGKVRQKSSAWDARRSRIETTVTLEIQEYIKGNGSREIAITTPGGEVGGIGEIYSHSARFEKDEDVVVFAKRDRNNRYQVTGGASGRQRITTDPATGRKLVDGKDRFDDYISGLKTTARGGR